MGPNADTAGALGAVFATGSGFFPPKNMPAAGVGADSAFLGGPIGAPSGKELEEVGNIGGLGAVAAALGGGNPNEVVAGCAAAGVVADGVLLAFAKKLGTDGPVAGVGTGVAAVVGAAEGFPKFSADGAGAVVVGAGVPKPNDFGASFAGGAAATGVKPGVGLNSAGLLEFTKKLGTGAADGVADSVGAEIWGIAGLFCSSVTFFCSCNLCLIFDIASASKSCFSHFEYDLECFSLGLSGLAAIGLWTTPVIRPFPL